MSSSDVLIKVVEKLNILCNLMHLQLRYIFARYYILFDLCNYIFFNDFYFTFFYFMMHTEIV